MNFVARKRPVAHNISVMLSVIGVVLACATAYRCSLPSYEAIIAVESGLAALAWIATDVQSAEHHSDCNPFGALLFWSVMRFTKITPPRDDIFRLCALMTEAVSLVILLSYSICSIKRLANRAMAESAREFGHTIAVE